MHVLLRLEDSVEGSISMEYMFQILNVLLNCQIHYIVVNNVFLQFNKCVK